MPTLALTVIARDEEAMLPACLASVRGVVDEIVVVDTGSRDKTIELARAAGARVVEQPWADDFSAARNRALAETRCDWVLVLDADERLTHDGARALKAALSDGDFEVGMVALHNAFRPDAEIEAVARGEGRLGDVGFLPRLLRRRDDLRYTGIVHENVGEWLFRTGGRTKLLPAVQVVHLGAGPEIRDRRDKRRRNIALLERFCGERPDDPTPCGYLAHEYLEAGERERARAVADRGWSLLLAGTRAMELPWLRLVNARALLQVQSGDPAGAHETLRVAEARMPGHPDLAFLRGCALETEALAAIDAPARRAALEAALREYDAALAAKGRVFVEKFVDGGTGWASEARRGTVLLLLGRATEARAAFDRARATHPLASGDPATFAAASREARLGTVEAALALGDLEGVLRQIPSHLDDRPDGWTLAALTAEAAGDHQQMARFIGKAQETIAAGFVAPHRRERYHDALVALGAYVGQTVDAPGPLGAVAKLASGGTPGPQARGLDDAIVRGLVGRLVRHWLRTGAAANVERLATSQASASLPGVLELLGEVLETMAG